MMTLMSDEPASLHVVRADEAPPVAHAFVPESSRAIRVRGTEIVATDTAQEYRQKLARITLDEMYQFVALLDATGTLLEVNRAALEGAGLTLSDVEGKPFWKCFWWGVSEETQEALRKAISRAASGEFVRYDVEIYGRASGRETIVIDFSMIPVKDESGTVVFIVPEGRDITEKKAHERLLAEKLAEIDRAKTAFFSNVSHEFRTPLTLILAPLEDALSSPGAALVGKSLETVHRNSLRLLKLVNTLLDFSRIEAGRTEAKHQPTDLSVLTADLASCFRSLVEKTGLTLTVDCPPLNEPVYVDREMYEKVVFNLLSNAFKFTFTGGIRVSLDADRGHARLVVADTGTGIPEAELPHLFDRFHRVAGAKGRSYEGSGIGLALVQELAKLQGGSLSVKSRLGEGSHFTVSLPLGKAHLPPEHIETASTLAFTGLGATPFLDEASQWVQDTPVGPAAREQGKRHAVAPVVDAVLTAKLSGRRILLADDNADMREYVWRLLTAQGWEVEAVGDGEAALQCARARLPDLVLTDVMMPGLDGFGLLKALKADERTRAVPVILVSARAGEAASIEGMRKGADDYLVKPFSMKELVSRVAARLDIARARAEAVKARAQLPLAKDSI
jgi:PAS domain S-box-containing protein